MPVDPTQMPPAAPGAPVAPGGKPPPMLPNDPGNAPPRGFGADQAPPPSGDPYEGEDQPATEEEQAQYDLVVARAVKFIHGEGRENTLKMMAAGAKPAEGVGTAAANIVKMIEQSAGKSGKAFADGVLFHAGAEIVEELMEFGEQAGVFEFRDDAEAQQEMDESIMYALKAYGEGGLAAGTIPQEEIDSSKKYMQEGIAREEANGTAPPLPAELQQQAPNPAVQQGVQQAMGRPGLVNGAM